MFKALVLFFALAFLVGAAAPGQARPTHWDKANIEAIYRDPMFVSAKGVGKLSKKSDERYPFRRGGFAQKTEYQLVAQQKEVGSFSLFRYPGGATSVLISASSDVPAVDAKANWNTLTKNWDAFVARHWPDAGFRRTADLGKSAFPKTSPYFYNLSVTYSAVQQGIEVASLQLRVQPEDGKILMVDCSDDRELLRGFSVPPAISFFQLVKAMLVWSDSSLKFGGKMSLDALSGTIGERKLGFDFVTQRATTLTSVSFRVVNAKGRGYTVYAWHNDAAKQIESWTTHPDPEELMPAT